MEIRLITELPVEVAEILLLLIPTDDPLTAKLDAAMLTPMVIPFAVELILPELF
jgi:hypothetical protein